MRSDNDVYLTYSASSASPTASDNKGHHSIILAVEGVSRRFGSVRDGGFRVLDDVDIDIEKGKITAIIGSNGAGKTSLFNIISGYLETDAKPGKSSEFSIKDFSRNEPESERTPKQKFFGFPKGGFSKHPQGDKPFGRRRQEGTDISNPSQISQLWKEIKSCIKPVQEYTEDVASLNRLLIIPDLYDHIDRHRQEEVIADSWYLAFLVNESASFRGKGGSLSRAERKTIKKLNRKLLETLFPDVCPAVEEGIVLFHNKEGKAELLNGKSPDEIARMGIGRLFQDGHLFANMSILDNMAAAAPRLGGESIPGALFKRNKIKRDEAALETEALLIFREVFPKDDPFSYRLGDYFHTLSYGQQRILALLRLFMGDYRLLLLDEPTAGVNVEVIDKMAGIIKGMKEKGRSVVLIEHNWEFVMEVADYCYFLDEGKVAAFGTPADVLGNPEVRARYLGR